MAASSAAAMVATCAGSNRPAARPAVTPARCLAICAFDPGPALRRLDDQGQPSPRGKHRVDAAAVPGLGDLIKAARAAGYRMRINSAYRSYREQARVFRATKEPGRAA